MARNSVQEAPLDYHALAVENAKHWGFTPDLRTQSELKPVVDAAMARAGTGQRMTAAERDAVFTQKFLHAYMLDKWPVA